MPKTENSSPSPSQDDRKRNIPTSTVGRGKPVTLQSLPRSNRHTDELVTLCHGDSLDHYAGWSAPTVIVSDGAYGILGFEGDTSDHLDMPLWYEPHVASWSRYASPVTTLWFWNSEIGWAAVHPVLEKYGWRYVNANIWNKGVAHIAGNVNTAKIRRFPVVSEVCVQYVLEARVNGLPLKQWLLAEWKRSGLPNRAANDACGVKDVATRKYFDQGHLWYYPPPEMFERLVAYANMHGDPLGRPYFSRDGARSTFCCRLETIMRLGMQLSAFGQICRARGASSARGKNGPAVFAERSSLKWRSLPSLPNYPPKSRP